LYAGVKRDQAGLNRLAEIACEVQAAADSAQASEVTNYNLQLVDLLQLDVMCEVAQVVAGSALLRQESRGHHFRTDFPQQDDDNWLQHTLAIRTENGPRFSTKPVI
jgi:succinate dehydrogenase/fumarate reductase flavoprotein subunit